MISKQKIIKLYSSYLDQITGEYFNDSSYVSPNESERLELINLLVNEIPEIELVQSDQLIYEVIAKITTSLPINDNSKNKNYILLKTIKIDHYITALKYDKMFAADPQTIESIFDIFIDELQVDNSGYILSIIHLYTTILTADYSVISNKLGQAIQNYQGAKK